ncbi:MAG: hypothetical protein ABIH82_01045 [Candidatus Woesearchaeota archaeon]
MNIKRGLITIAIAIIFALFIGYGIEVFHDSPNMEKFCPNVYDILNQEECEVAEGVWRPETQVNSIENIEGEPIRAKPVTGYCNTKSTCYEDFSVIMSQHDKVVFIVAAIFGLLAIIAGIIITVEGVNNGFIAGGILLILYGTIRYWQHANDILKFILLGLVLAVLVWLGYKKLDLK